MADEGFAGLDVLALVADAEAPLATSPPQPSFPAPAPHHHMEEDDPLAGLLGSPPPATYLSPVVPTTEPTTNFFPPLEQPNSVLVNVKPEPADSTPPNAAAPLLPQSLPLPAQSIPAPAGQFAHPIPSTPTPQPVVTAAPPAADDPGQRVLNDMLAQLPEDKKPEMLALFADTQVSFASVHVATLPFTCLIQAGRLDDSAFIIKANQIFATVGTTLTDALKARQNLDTPANTQRVDIFQTPAARPAMSRVCRHCIQASTS